MDSKVTVFLIVMLLAALRGLMQRSQVRREIEARKVRRPLASKGRRIQNRIGPAVEFETQADDSSSEDSEQKKT
jgi:hypothetical protein